MKNLVTQTWDGLSAKNRDVSIIIPPYLPEILGDFRLIQVVWQNLLSNALKFSQSKANRVITISAKVKGEFVEYCVADTGVGFDMKQSDLLFIVFTKLHAELNYAGTGIGLSVAQRIIKMHGGNMWATGEVGVGANFYFTLPLVK
jgi:light-regulated signal transduction histidine kinase (bacteriophytochrome)